VGIFLELHHILSHFYLGADGEDGGSGDVRVKHSLAYIQLEKHNERLKEALVRFVWLLCDLRLFRLSL